MSDIKLINSDNLETNITNIANAIRAKVISGKKYQITDFPNIITSIQNQNFSYDDIAQLAIKGDIFLSDNITTIARSAFSGHKITSIRANNISYIGESAFNACSLLKSVILKGSDTTMGNFAFRFCSALEELRIPNASPSFSFKTMGINRCPSLRIIDYGFTNSLKFESLSAPNLNTIILHNATKVQALSSGTILNSTKFKEGGDGGTVYIPEVMYNHLGDGSSLDYKASTNWAIYDGYGTITWAKLEGSIYDEPGSIAGLSLPQGTWTGTGGYSGESRTVTVSNGNHIHIITPVTWNYGYFILTQEYNLSIPANAEITLKIKNFTINSTDTFMPKSISISNKLGKTITATINEITAEGNYENTAINTYGNIIEQGIRVYCTYNGTPENYEFDIELYVNGTRWV